MKKILLIFFILSYILFADYTQNNISIKADDFYIEEIPAFYFGNLKDLINNKEFSPIEKDFSINKENLLSMKKMANDIYSQNGYVNNIEYNYTFSSHIKNLCYKEVLVSYEIITNEGKKNYNTVVYFGYSFFNGSNFKITFFREQLIKIIKIDYSKIEKIIKNYKNNNEEVIEKLEKEGIKTITKYCPIELEFEKYCQYLNDYSYFISETDRYKEAIPILERVILISPNRVVAYLNLGDCYYKEYKKYNKQSDKYKVIENYKKYVSLLKKDAKIPERVKEMLNK